MPDKIQIFNTFIHPAAAGKVSEVITSTFLSEGKITEQFEQELKKVFGFNNIVTLNSGTSALHLALDLLEIGPGDEVIIPAQTFIATGLAVLYCKATPVFADINYEDGNLNVDSVRSKITSKTKAIITVHWGGYPCDMNGLKEVAEKNNIKIIDDAAHALGASYDNQPVGNIADITCFSFQAIKHLTTGDGGAITMNDTALYEKALKKKWFGIDRKNSKVSDLGERVYDLTDIGYKYHLNNYASALGLANLTGYMDRLQHRNTIVKIYREKLASCSKITLFKQEANRTSANWLFGFHVDDRRTLISKLKESGIESSVVHQRIDKYSIFGGVNTSLTNMNRFDETQLHIPIHDAITIDQAEIITDAIIKAL